MLETATGLPEKIIPNDATICMQEFSLRVKRYSFLVFFYSNNTYNKCYGAVWKCICCEFDIQTPIFSANPDCTIEVHPFSFAILVMGLSIWTASQWVITALRFVSIIIHFGKLDIVCNNCAAKQQNPCIFTKTVYISIIQFKTFFCIIHDCVYPPKTNAIYNLILRKLILQ